MLIEELKILGKCKCKSGVILQSEFKCLRHLRLISLSEVGGEEFESLEGFISVQVFTVKSL